MESTAALAVDLALLTAALDLTGTDIAETLRLLQRDVMAAVPSYLGLTVTVQVAERAYTFSVSAERPEPHDVQASVRIPLGPAAVGSASLTIFASQPGACVDLAADLAWLTRADLVEFDLDADLIMPDGTPIGLRDASTINQAIGVLIAGGLTVDQAHYELDVRALAAGRDRLAMAADILAAVPTGDGVQARADE